MHTNSDRTSVLSSFFPGCPGAGLCYARPRHLSPVTYPPSSFYPVSSPLDRSSLVLLVLCVLPLCLGLGVVFEMGILGWFPLFPGCSFLAPFCGLMEPWFLFFFLTDRLIFSVLFSLFSLFPFNAGNRRAVFFCVSISRTPKHCQPPPGWSSTSRLCVFLAPATLLCSPLSSFRLALCMVFSPFAWSSRHQAPPCQPPHRHLPRPGHCCAPSSRRSHRFSLFLALPSCVLLSSALSLMGFCFRSTEPSIHILP